MPVASADTPALSATGSPPLFPASVDCVIWTFHTRGITRYRFPHVCLLSFLPGNMNSALNIILTPTSQVIVFVIEGTSALRKPCFVQLNAAPVTLLSIRMTTAVRGLLRPSRREVWCVCLFVCLWGEGEAVGFYSRSRSVPYTHLLG